MNITRKIKIMEATYDFDSISEEEFDLLCKAYYHYMMYIQQCPPKEEDSLWKKMNKLQEDKIKTV